MQNYANPHHFVCSVQFYQKNKKLFTEAALFCNLQVSSIGCVGENAIFVQFYVILPGKPSFIQLVLTVTRNDW